MTARPTLDIAALRSFALGFELGSFARAAERVGRSQSAVTSQLRKLEQQVGQPLVTRAGRGLALTEAGDRLLRYARRILDLHDEAVDSIRHAGVEGWVRLGLAHDFAESWLPEVLGRFARAHPRVRVEVQTDKSGVLAEKIRRGELDLGLGWGPALEVAQAERVADVPMVWVGRAGWRRDDLPAGEAVPLLAFEPPCAFRDGAVAALNGQAIAWRLAVLSPSLAGLWAAAAAGLGVTMRTQIGLPAGLTTLDPAQAGLPALPNVSLTMFRKQAQGDRTVALLTDILLGVIRERCRVGTVPRSRKAKTLLQAGGT